MASKLLDSLRPLIRWTLLVLSLVVLAGCEHNMVIINDVDEREANEIVVFLASKGIPATKTASASNAPGGGETGMRWNINVESDQATDAMAILNQNGLPRKKGTNLLDLFAKAGLMSSEKEETIRYQAGLAEQIASMIRKIDGVLDADVQLSFPPEETNVFAPGGATAAPKRITAAVYVKHQGVLDDPNSHLISKIKRLVSGSVTGLDLNDVTVISDRARFTDVTLNPTAEVLEPKGKEYVSIWSIVMSKSSAGRFRVIFFFLMLFAILFALLVAWMIWKFYPLLKKRGGLKALFQPLPIEEQNALGESKKPPEAQK
ncbi:MAG: type III secretion inner membrane ring lipoprotein SctJ [Verrucomicrobia bacterium]|nr:type III secretion inner membrane ring lipoprotein SctJ [Verrucomicrobiota bacterium]